MDLRSVLKRCRYKIITPPQLKDNAAFDVGFIDTQGLAGVAFLFATGDMDAAAGSGNATTAPKIVECDTTDGTYTDITGAALSAAIANDQDETLRGIFVDLTKSHKRYLQPSAPTAGDGTTGVEMAIIAIGFPSENFPDGAAAAGLAELVEA